MATYTISRLASRTGLPVTTLRFYERAGLLAEPPRSPAGYRLYGDSAVARLRLVRRARRLGLPIAGVRELIAAWEHLPCAGVQAALDRLLARHIVQLEEDAAELAARSAVLAAARAELSGDDTGDRCSESCVCLTGARGAAEPNVACTLPPDQRPARAHEWAAAVARAVRREELADGVRLTFPPVPGLAASLAELAAREQQCCSFFAFTLRLRPDATALEVRGPAHTRDLLRRLLAPA